MNYFLEFAGQYFDHESKSDLLVDESFEGYHLYSFTKYMITYNSSILTKPLLYLPPRFDSEASNISLYIHSICDSENINLCEVYRDIQSLLKIGCDSSSDLELVDEIYVQIMKNCTESPDYIQINSLKLLLTCIQCFLPSDRLRSCLIKYLQGTFKDNNLLNTISGESSMNSTSCLYNISSKCLKLLATTSFEYTPRGLPLNSLQILSIFKDIPVYLQVTLSTGVRINFPSDSTTTTKNLITDIGTTLNLPRRYWEQHRSVDDKQVDSDTSNCPTYMILYVDSNELNDNREEIAFSYILDDTKFLHSELACFELNLMKDSSFSYSNLSDDVHRLDLVTDKHNRCYAQVENVYKDFEMFTFHSKHEFEFRKDISLLYSRLLRLDISIHPLIQEINEPSSDETAVIHLPNISQLTKLQNYECVFYPTNETIITLLLHQILRSFIYDVSALGIETTLYGAAILVQIFRYRLTKDYELINYDVTATSIEESLGYLLPLSLIDVDSSRIEAWKRYLSKEIYHYWETYTSNFTTCDIVRQLFMFTSLYFKIFSILNFLISSYEIKISNNSSHTYQELSAGVLKQPNLLLGLGPKGLVIVYSKFSTSNQCETPYAFKRDASSFRKGDEKENFQPLYSISKQISSDIQSRNIFTENHNLPTIATPLTSCCERRIFSSYKQLRDNSHYFPVSNKSCNSSPSTDKGINLTIEPINNARIKNINKVEIHLNFIDILSWFFKDSTLTIYFNDKGIKKVLVADCSQGYQVCKLLTEYKARDGSV